MENRINIQSEWVLHNNKEDVLYYIESKQRKHYTDSIHRKCINVYNKLLNLKSDDGVYGLDLHLISIETELTKITYRQNAMIDDYEYFLEIKSYYDRLDSSLELISQKYKLIN